MIHVDFKRQSATVWDCFPRYLVMEHESICLSFIYVVPVSRNEEWLVVLDKPYFMTAQGDFEGLTGSTVRLDESPSLLDQWSKRVTYSV